jgi:asparagine synthase (glutamine-hydrolysing)
MGAWLKQDLAPVMHALLSDPSLGRRDLFNTAEVRELIGLHDANRIDGTDRLLALMNLEIWARLYLDRRTPEDVTAELEGALV